jgi:hypothetical protein
VSGLSSCCAQRVDTSDQVSEGLAATSVQAVLPVSSISLQTASSELAENTVSPFECVSSADRDRYLAEGTSERTSTARRPEVIERMPVLAPSSLPGCYPNNFGGSGTSEIITRDSVRSLRGVSDPFMGYDAGSGPPAREHLSSDLRVSINERTM